MRKLSLVFGVAVLIFAVVDVVHGQHNGDQHRFYIHLVEFISFVGCLILVEIQAVRFVAKKIGGDFWLASVFVSVMSVIGGFTLFGLSGGSGHGDGGPLAVGFGLMGIIGLIALPISVIGRAVMAVILIVRMRNSLKRKNS